MFEGVAKGILELLHGSCNFFFNRLETLECWWGRSGRLLPGKLKRSQSLDQENEKLQENGWTRNDVKKHVRPFF